MHFNNFLVKWQYSRSERQNSRLISNLGSRHISSKLTISKNRITISWRKWYHFHSPFHSNRKIAFYFISQTFLNTLYRKMSPWGAMLTMLMFALFPHFVKGSSYKINVIAKGRILCSCLFSSRRSRNNMVPIGLLGPCCSGCGKLLMQFNARFM